MLLFVKKRFADAIRDGSKTIEIRCGKRYAGITAGRQLSINGQFRVSVSSVDRFASSDELLEGVDLSRIGCPAHELSQRLRGYYPDCSGPWFAIYLDSSAVRQGHE